MSTKINPTYEELSQVLASRLKQNCPPLVTAALDRCWISYWYRVDPGFQGLLARQSSTLREGSSLRILVLQSNSAIAIAYLQAHWRDVAQVWHALTGSSVYVAVFAGSPGNTSENAQPVLFETDVCSRVEVEI